MVNMFKKKSNPRKVAEALLSISEEKEKYTASFTSFSGGDMIFLINDVGVGEIMNIDYTENIATDNPSTGVINAAVLGQSWVRTLLTGNDTLAILFSNEYGNRHVMVFEGFKVHTRTQKLDVESFIQTEQFHFTFSSITYKRDFEYDIETNTYQFKD